MSQTRHFVSVLPSSTRIGARRIEGQMKASLRAEMRKELQRLLETPQGDSPWGQKRIDLLEAILKED